MGNKMASILKWLWLIAVLLFIILFVQKNTLELGGAIKQINISSLLLSFLCIIAAKILLALFMRYALRSVGKEMNFLNCFRIYNISQLGKYIPGNIWHFVGKAVAYKDNGFSMTTIRDALVVENVWLVAGAFGYGLILTLIFNFYLIQRLLLSYSMYVAVFLVIAFLLVLLGEKVMKISLGQIFSDHRLIFKIILLQVVIWSLLGLGFAVLAVPFIAQEGASIFLFIGLYAIAYSIGFVTPFAPAGIGVREAVLAIGSWPFLSLDVVITLSVANRAVYLLVELILAFLSRTIVIQRVGK
jgi:uncharacterized membrane protein YbhN (UPF0104 family)